MKMDIIGVRGLRCNIVQFFATLFAKISADSSSKNQFDMKIEKKGAMYKMFSFTRQT